MAEPRVTPREDAIAEAGFAPLSELASRREELESWSQIVLAELQRDYITRLVNS